MTPHAAEVLRWFDALDKKLVNQGFPPTSEFWRDTIDRWYRGDRSILVGRVGRGGGKSSTMCRLAVVEAVYGLHKITPGDKGIVTIVSANREDASARLVTIKAILDALSYANKPNGSDRYYEEHGDTIELPARKVAFKVFTASIASVSGYTAIFSLLDEVAKWRDSKTSANPAEEVITSVRAARRGKPTKIALISSPMGCLDAHFDLFEEGETPANDQVVAHAPTWIANPTISEDATHVAEPDPLKWAREYAAVPQAEDESSLLTTGLVKVATRGEPLVVEPCPRHSYVATIDPATRGNAWTLAIAALSDNHVRRVVLAKDWMGSRAKPLKPGEVFAEIAKLIAPYGLNYVYSDQFSEDSLREIARVHGLGLVAQPWSAGKKAESYEALRTLFQEKRVELPPDPVVASDLLGIREKLTRNGVVYDLATQGARHSDYAPAIAMALSLCRVQPKMMHIQLSPAEQALANKKAFFKEREKEAKRAEKFGRMPVTHTRKHG